MPTRAQIAAEAYRRGLMPAQARVAYEEGVRRGLVKDAYAEGQISGHKNPVSAFMGTVTEAVPFADEANAALMSVGGMLKGKRPADAWRESRDWQAGQQNAFAQDHPTASNIATGGGYAVQMLPMFASGGATNAFAPVADGLKAGLGRYALKTAKNATVGASVAMANAASGRGTLKERSDAANAAALPGAVAGVAIPATVDAVIGGAKVVKKLATPTTRATIRAANNLASRTPAGAFLNPEEEAVARISETLRKDGLSGEQITAALSEWQRVGGPSPAFMDLVAQGGGGQNTMALIRGAAMSGPGRNAATKYGNQVAVDLQDNAIARTRALTPDTRPAAAVSQDLAETQGRLATEQYRVPYEARVQVPEDVTAVLSDAPGKAALRSARADALERMDLPRVREIDALLNGEPIDTVSAATLDRTRIAMGERGGKLSRAGNNSRAGGSFQRKNVIDSALDQVPEIRPARATYRAYQARQDAVEAGQGAMNAAPDQYAADVARLNQAAPEGVNAFAGVGHRQALTEAIGRPSEGATGVLNRVSGSTNQGRNLATSFGDQPAADYRQSIGQMVDQVQNARFINPNTGSQTAGRLSDEALVESIPTSKVGLITAILRKVKQHATLTDAEREILVRMATSRAPQDIVPKLRPPPARNAFAPSSQASVLAIPAGQSQANRR